MNRRFLLKLLSLVPFAKPALADHWRHIVRAADVPFTVLPTEPIHRLNKLKWMFNALAEHHLYSNAYSGSGNEGWSIRMNYQDEWKDGYTYCHWRVIGEGATAIDAIDDWFHNLPRQMVYAILWRVEPELDVQHDFCTDKTKWMVYSRFTIIPDALPGEKVETAEQNPWRFAVAREMLEG